VLATETKVVEKQIPVEEESEEEEPYIHQS